jgi:hypothetical protein
MRSLRARPVTAVRATMRRCFGVPSARARPCCTRAAAHGRPLDCTPTPCHVRMLCAAACCIFECCALQLHVRPRASVDCAREGVTPRCRDGAAASHLCRVVGYHASVGLLCHRGYHAAVGYYQLPSARESARWQPQCGPPGLTLRRWRLWTTRCGTSPGSPARRRWQACVAFVAPAHRASDLRPLAAPKRPRGNRLTHASFCCLRVLRSCGLN